MTSTSKAVIYLETSSYLPLVWRTPYSQPVIDTMTEYADHQFVLQRDCVLEAKGYLSFGDDDWRYHPAVRIRNILKRTTDSELREFGYPSAAIQLLLGGNIWPQAQYLNFVRHTVFFFADLLDGISFAHPREGLSEFADRIERRVIHFRQLFQDHAAAESVILPTEDILPYWGKWYLPSIPRRFTVRIIPDPRPFNMTTDKLRDIYHYECAVSSRPAPKLMLVANTGFERNVKTSFATLPCPIVCPKARTGDLFS
ncbi:MAG: hypothetical protein ABIK44_05290 [candidate division WOR-3 bacterium]